MHFQRALSHPFTSPLRYPGGKGQLTDFIKTIISANNLSDGHYIEPFAGGASIGWSMLFEEYIRHIHINDLDDSIYNFWISILEHTDNFCRLIRNTEVNIEQWYRQKEIYNSPSNYTSLEWAFSTFFLNRTNRSGIISGGVIGGKSQSGKWKIDARFNKEDLIQRIQRIARYKSRISVYCFDARKFLKQVMPILPKKALIYMDPPYFNKGKDLYQNHLSHEDHKSLAALVQNNVHRPWIVSYDAVPEISSLYKGRRQVFYNLSYSAQARYSGREVMYFSDNLEISRLSETINKLGKPN